MSKFMVRVNLLGGDSEGYERLDDLMQRKGFSRDLLGKKAMYQLPNGEYWYSGQSSASEVRTVAAAAAGKTGLEFGIIAVKVDGWSVMGLKKSEAPASE